MLTSVHTFRCVCARLDNDHVGKISVKAGFDTTPFPFNYITPRYVGLFFELKCRPEIALLPPCSPCSPLLQLSRPVSLPRLLPSFFFLLFSLIPLQDEYCTIPYVLRPVFGGQNMLTRALMLFCCIMKVHKGASRSITEREIRRAVVDASGKMFYCTV